MHEPRRAPDVGMLDSLLAREGPLGPKPERVSESFADERIRGAIGAYADERAQAGLWSVNRTLRDRAVPAEVRLHLITAVAHLGRIAEATLADRRRRVR